MSVHLVGAGPGDPGLITARGLELVRACDVLIHDALVSPDLVAESPDDALVIPRAPLRQKAINDLLVAYGRAGLDVVRLKGGDPFVFGRSGEEALALAEAGVPFTVTPGVSSIAAVPAAASIPITHRGVSARVTIATPAGEEEPDYAALARAGGTLVLFMALERLPSLAAGLLAAGLDPSTPAAVIANGTLPEQEVVSEASTTSPASLLTSRPRRSSSSATSSRSVRGSSRRAAEPKPWWPSGSTSRPVSVWRRCVCQPGSTTWVSTRRRKPSSAATSSS